MTVKQLLDQTGWKLAQEDVPDLSREISCVYSCDLLSFAMGRAPADSAWVTIIGNVNAVAVASLADVACVVLADGVSPDNEAVQRASQQGIPLLLSPDPIFEIRFADPHTAYAVRTGSAAANSRGGSCSKASDEAGKAAGGGLVGRCPAWGIQHSITICICTPVSLPAVTGR